SGDKVYIIDVYNPDGSFDEHKVMLGFNDAATAREDFLKNYDEGWGDNRRIDMSEVDISDFEKWIESSTRKTKPFTEYKNIKSVVSAIDVVGGKEDKEEKLKNAVEKNGGYERKRWSDESDLDEMQARKKPNVKQQKAEGAGVVAAEEGELRDAIVELMRGAGIDVVTDSEEAQRVLEAANVDARLQASIGGLKKTYSFILSFLQGKTGQRSSKLEIPARANYLAEKAIGHKINSHTIKANELTHTKKRHGINGTANTEHSIPLRDEDFALMPYIMSAPTRVVKGTSAINGTESVRYEKELSDGIVIVVEREGRFDVEDMENITMWAEKKSATNVTVTKKASHSTSETIVISEADAAKIRKDAETAIKNDEKVREQRVFHGSGADFGSFDFSHMGEGEGAQAYGWGGYVSEVEGIGRTYAKAMLSERHKENRIINQLARDAIKSSGSKEEAVKYLNTILNEPWSDKKRVRTQIKIIKSGKFLPEGKSILYNVDIPDDNGENYIDYAGKITDRQYKKIGDKLVEDGWVREESGILSIFKKDGKKIVLNRNATGADVYLELEDALNGSRQASEAFDRMGFVGISYPAQYMTGGRQDKARNYVIFNEKNMKITDKVRFFRTRSGEAYGFVAGGKVYIDTRIAGADTPIHEYTHLWAEALRSENPMEWKNVVELMKGCKEIWERVKREYPELTTDDEIADEVLAQ
ncbi:MAG: hypothetical protein ACI4TU_04475, partial [Candidatus Cryptobacteroides sp.]